MSSRQKRNNEYGLLTGYYERMQFILILDRKMKIAVYDSQPTV